MIISRSAVTVMNIGVGAMMSMFCTYAYGTLYAVQELIYTVISFFWRCYTQLCIYERSNRFCYCGTKVWWYVCCWTEACLFSVSDALNRHTAFYTGLTKIFPPQQHRESEVNAITAQCMLNRLLQLIIHVKNSQIRILRAFTLIASSIDTP
jgi:hypothetical protein